MNSYQEPAAEWARRYAVLVHRALTIGETRSSRDGDTRELGPTTVRVDRPGPWVEVPGRNGKAQFAMVEQLCYLAGTTPDPLTLISPRFQRYKKTAGTRKEWWGAYGPRLKSGMRSATNELALRPDSRRVWVPIYNGTDLAAAASNDPPNDIPCTLGIGFWRDPATGKLQAHAQMRSCDLWFGLYYDAPAYAMLQRAMAIALCTEPGQLWVTATSMHLYERHAEQAADVEPLPLTVAELPLPDHDSMGDVDGPIARMVQLQDWAAQALGRWLSSPNPADMSTGELLDTIRGEEPTEIHKV